MANPFQYGQPSDYPDGISQFGNYPTRIQSIKHEVKEHGKQFVIEFANDDGRLIQGFWYQHDTSEMAQKIGRDNLETHGVSREE